jgi:integrase
MRLTETKVRGLKARDRRYEVGEEGGLRVRVSTRGTKTWVYVFWRDGRMRRLTLGHFPTMRLAAARKAASEARQLHREAQIDPARVAQDEKSRWKAAETVKELAEQYIDRYAKPRKRTWITDQRMLQNDLFPYVGNWKARDVRRRDMIAILERIQQRAPTQANRGLEIFRKMFNWGIERELLDVNPCWGISKPTKESRRERVLSDDELRTVWQALNRDRSPGSDLPDNWPSRTVRRAIQLVLLTGTRRAEVGEALLEEFDLSGGWWTIPGRRCKNGHEHRVWLTEPAREIVRELREYAIEDDKDYLLPSPRGNHPMKPTSISCAVSRLREHIGIPHWQLHDLRRTSASRMGALGVQRLVIAKVLNHTDQSVTAIYDRHSYDEEKRHAWEKWADSLMKII